MKVLFFILLTLNLAYAAWSLLLSPQAPELRQALMEASSSVRRQPQPRQIIHELEGSQTIGDQVSDEELAKDPAATCWMLGPFEDDGTANALQQRLQAQDVRLQLKTLVTPVAPDYWVYIEPQRSRQAALRLLRELQASQIDSFIIGEGQLENGISLGFFPDEKSARKVMRRRTEDGYAVKIKSVARSAEEIWAVLQLAEYNKLKAGQWQKLQRELGKWQQRQNYCKLIASQKQLE